MFALEGAFAFRLSQFRASVESDLRPVTATAAAEGEGTRAWGRCGGAGECKRGEEAKIHRLLRGMSFVRE